MKHSGGNPEAAFELIGMCGHDDIGQGSYSYFDFSESAKQKNAEQLLKLKEQKKKLDGDLKRAFSKFSSSEKDKTLVYQLGQHGAFLSNQINLMSSQDYAGRIENLSCPSQSSAFFLPGSLSPQADLNPNLVSKIKNIQIANPQKEHFIPAKYYHVYGSAFLGCKMVQKGMSPAQATAVQKQAARLYRGIRMCGAAGWMLQAREQMQKTLGVKNLDDSSEVEPMVIKLWEAKLHGEFTCNGMLISIDPDNIKEEKVKNSPDKNLPTNNKYNSEKCSILSMFGVTDLVENERHIVTKKILKGLERIDAAKLYDDWYFGGGHIAGTQMPCTDIRYKGPANLMKPNEGIMGKIFKPSGWSSDRYEVASKRLATYDVDFEWTIAQHEVGSSYGAKLCAESKGKVNPFEEKACSEKNHTPAQNRSGDPAGGMMSSPGVK